MPTDAQSRLTTRRYGSDFIVDILRQYGIPYAAFNPGASFRGIHDSLINYLGNGSMRSWRSTTPGATASR